MIRGYKIRIYPTKDQEKLMWKHINACRFIWNYMIETQQKTRDSGGKYISAFGMINLLKPLKNDDEHNWLYEVSNHSLQIVCKNLDQRYSLFFDKTSDYPHFKSKKKTKPIFPIRTDRFYFKNDKYVHVEKIGDLKYRTDFMFKSGMQKYNFYNTRISYVNGKWLLSFGLEHENQVQELTNISMGIDLGVKELAVVEYDSNGIVFRNINKTKKMKDIENKIKFYQRRASRKYEANRSGNKYNKTKNIIKIENKMRKLYAHQSNIRLNYIHQITHCLVSLKPRRIVMEKLNVQGMLKNKHLSKAIREQCFAKFIRIMKYKCEQSNIEFVQADRFYSSSKTCSCCGHIKKDLKLSDRVYVCEECGNVIDRDYNAAINLSRYTV